MKTSKTITVTTDEENPLTVELIAEAIVSISDSMKKINNTRLTRRALILLIAENCDAYHIGRKRMVVNTKTIEIVMKSIDNLKSAYIKDLPKTKGA
jgi:hypothetical protein